jgi:hypothetical protein
VLLLAWGRKFFAGFELDPLDGFVGIGRFGREETVYFTAEDEAMGSKGCVDDRAVLGVV